MKNLIFILLFSFCCLQNGQTQIKDFLKKVDETINEAVNEIESGEIGEKLEEAVEQISEEIDAGLEESGNEMRTSDLKLEEESEEVPNDEVPNAKDNNTEESFGSSLNKALNGILGTNGPADNIEPNTEIISFKMESTIVASENKKVPKGSGYTAYYAFDQWMTGMHMEYFEEADNEETSISKIVLNLEEKTKTMCTRSKNGEWTGIKMWMTDYTINLGDQGLSNDETISPTGNTKTIEGYLCEEFEINDGEVYGTVWATKQIDINLALLSKSLMGGLGFKMKSSQPSQEYLQEYFWLESNLRDDANKTRTVSTINNIRTGANIDKSQFNLSGIDIQTDMTK